jgi:phage baseplate assembly protein W
MAAIYLDNLVNPQKVQSRFTNIANEPDPSAYVYRDLHLDLSYIKNIGNGLTSVNSNDVVADYDIFAIRNSIYNIFTTKPGEKILNPAFGCSLEMFLFETLSEFKANIIGNQILNNLTKFEPRIDVTKVLVYPNYEMLQYEVSIYYSIPSKGLLDTLQMNFTAGNQSSIHII